jgi:hypothetical protein
MQQLVAGLRWVAALAGTALLAAACSSGSPSASPGGSSATDLSVALSRFVQCMHTHGEHSIYLSHAPSSPTPGSTLIIFHGFAIQGADPGSPQFGMAMKACQQLMPHGTPPDAAEQRQAFIKALQATRCMRAHGYPAWPDPTEQGPYNMQAVPTGIDTNSPQFAAAAKTCGVSLPPGGAG